jgi:hypothetical protein
MSLSYLNDSIYLSDSIESTKSAKSAKSAKSIESIESNESTESTESSESNESTKSTNKIESDIDNNFKKFYFPNVNNINYNDIQITTEGRYSISSNTDSDKLIYLIKKYLKTTNITITDGTANNGSDSIALALVFDHVNSIELDKINFSVLKNNVNAYKLKNINIYNDDSIIKIPNLTQDVIYIDAPWGGG